MVESIGDFGTSALPYPPSLDENGADLSQSAQVRVWTATNPDTTYFGSTCTTPAGAFDWSGTAGQTLAGVLDGSGNVLSGGSLVQCTTPLHLYCFGVDRAATLQ